LNLLKEVVGKLSSWWLKTSIHR